MPSVAQTRAFGSRVALRTACDARLRPLGDEPRGGAGDERRAPRRARPASATSEIDPVDARRVDVRLGEEAVEGNGEDRRRREREPDHASDRLDGADERHREDSELVEREAVPAAAHGEERGGDEREEPEERGGRVGLRPLPLAQDRGERRVDEHQVVVGDELRPVGRREDGRGREDDERERDPREPPCAHQLDDPEKHREPRTEDDRAVEVRPDDEEREHEQGLPARSAPRRVDEQPENTCEERKRRGLRAQRPAPRAGENREDTDDEGRPRRRPARPGGREGECEREEHEPDPQQDHGAHARDAVRGVEHDLGEPLLVGPRAALAEDGQVLGVGQPVLDDLAAGHQREPGVADDDRRGKDGEEDDADEADEQDRERARLEDTPEASLRRWRPTSLAAVSERARGDVVGVGLKSDTALASGVVGLTRQSSLCAPERLSGPWARVGCDPCPMPLGSLLDDAWSVTVVPDSSVVRAGAASLAPDVPGTGRSRSLAVAAARRNTDLDRLPRPRDSRNRPRRRVGHAPRRPAAAAPRRRRVHGGRLLAAGGAVAPHRRHRTRAAPLRRDGRRRRRGEQRAPGARRGSPPRALGVPRRVLGRPRARDRDARPRLRHPRARRLPAGQPAARDGRGLGRPDRRRLARGARRRLGADPRGARVHAQAAAFATGAPRAPAPLPARHPRGPVRPALGRARRSSGSG